MRAMRMMLAVLAVLVLLPFGAAAAQPSAIVVRGTGLYSMEPDQASVNIGIVTVGEDAQAAQQENMRTSERLQKYLQSLSIDRDQISTSYYYFYPQYKDNTIIGYQVTNTLTVKVNDLSKLGSVIDKCVELGANQITSIEFSVKNDENLKRRAITGAVADAKDKAAILAKELSMKVVRVVKLTEQNIYMENRSIAKVMNAADAGATAINPRKVTATANVEIEFEVQ